MDVFENFLSDFLQSFSAGISASGHGPGANLRGAGAAMQAPFQRSVQLSELQQQRGLSQSEQNLRNRQAAEAAARGEYYRSQGAAITAASNLVPVQIPNGQGGTDTIMLPAKSELLPAIRPATWQESNTVNPFKLPPILLSNSTVVDRKVKDR